MKYPLITAVNNNPRFILSLQKLLSSARDQKLVFSDHVVLHDDLTDDNQALLESWGWVTMKLPPIQKELSAGTEYPATTWLRSLIPSYFDCSHCLWLDADTWFSGSIDLPEFDEAVSMVSGKGDGIFNAGVMLMNLDKWRNHGFGDKAIKVGLRHYEKYGVGPQYVDQAAFNLVIPFESRRYLPLKYNYTPSDPTHKIDDPSIIHWKAAKPWLPQMCKWEDAQAAFKYFDSNREGFERHWEYVTDWNKIEPKTDYLRAEHSCQPTML